MEQKPAWWYTQSGVIAYRLGTKAVPKHETFPEIEVLLITSRKRKHWIIPKGVVEPGMLPQTSAAKEAFEEAGIAGNVSDHAIGMYRREKWQGTCTVEVFLLEVTTVFDEWPERAIRDREWMGIEEAIRRIREEHLQNLFRKVPGLLYQTP